MNMQSIGIWVLCVLFAVTAGAVCNESFDDAASGWSGPWCSNAELTQPAALSVDAQSSLPLPENTTPPAAGGRVVDFSGAVFRGLGEGQELTLADASPLYIRMAIRRTVSDEEGKSRSVSLLFNDGLERKLLVGCSSSGKLAIVCGEALSQTPKTANAMDHAYLWLIRIDAPDADGKRIVRMLSLHESQSFEQQEPTVWSLVSDPLPLQGVIDRIGIAAGKSIRLEFDELRIARTWNELIGK